MRTLLAVSQLSSRTFEALAPSLLLGGLLAHCERSFKLQAAAVHVCLKKLRAAAFAEDESAECELAARRGAMQLRFTS